MIRSAIIGVFSPMWSMLPAQRRQCWVAASFMGPDESALRHDIGLDKLMWGADYPHVEGSYPYTREHLRQTVAGQLEVEVRSNRALRLFHCRFLPDNKFCM